MQGLTNSMITKRDGSRQAFDSSKIEAALLKAGRASGEFDADVAAQLTELTLLQLATLPPDTPLTVELAQDMVETALYEAGYRATLRRYVVYREQHATLRQDRHSLVDVASSINEYLDRQDWRVNANANQGYSLGGLILNVSGKVSAYYWLNHVYPP